MLPRGEVGCRTLNDHGNYIIDHGKIMEKSWNFVFEFLWEPCINNGKAHLCEIFLYVSFLVTIFQKGVRVMLGFRKF